MYAAKSLLLLLFITLYLATVNTIWLTIAPKGANAKTIGNGMEETKRRVIESQPIWIPPEGANAKTIGNAFKGKATGAKAAASTPETSVTVSKPSTSHAEVNGTDAKPAASTPETSVTDSKLTTSNVVVNGTEAKPAASIWIPSEGANAKTIGNALEETKRRVIESQPTPVPGVADSKPSTSNVEVKANVAKPAASIWIPPEGANAKTIGNAFVGKATGVKAAASIWITPEGANAKTIGNGMELKAKLANPAGNTPETREAESKP